MPGRKTPVEGSFERVNVSAAKVNADMLAMFEEGATDGNDGVNRLYASAGLAPINVSDTDTSLKALAAKSRAKPNCDFCGKEGAGTKKCTVCLSAVYCSKECQGGDWKGGHKAACKSFQAECTATGLGVLSQLLDASLVPGSRRVQGLDRLDREGPYAAAVKGPPTEGEGGKPKGLHAVLVEVLKLDASELPGRWLVDGGREGFAYVNFIGCVLFRGQRAARQGGGVLWSTAKVDGARISAFLRSAPHEAWPCWLAAACACARAPLHKGVSGGPSHALAHRAARDTWVNLSLALARPEVARAVFLIPDDEGSEGANGDGDGGSAAAAASASRARSTASELRTLLNDLDAAGEARDPDAIIEANANQVAALLACWCRDLAVQGVDFEALLGLKGGRQAMYRGFALPLAEAMVVKGAMLTSEESTDALRAAQQTGPRVKKQGRR